MSQLWSGVIISELWRDMTEFFQSAGWVIWPIFAVALTLWISIFAKGWFLLRDWPAFCCSLIGSGPKVANESDFLRRSWRNQQQSIARLAAHQRIGLIKTLVALCPLLGLLGTVTGMIEVFEVLALTGTGNARLMAAGIGRATIPTMAGMVVSLSGIYFAWLLEQWSQRKVQLFEDQLGESYG